MVECQFALWLNIVINLYKLNLIIQKGSKVIQFIKFYICAPVKF